MTSYEQIDLAITLYANQFAGRSAALDKFVFDMAGSSILNGGVFMAVYWWLWFETGENSVSTRRRNIVVALLAASVVAAASRLMQVSLPFHHRPLHTPDVGFRVPFGVDPSSLNDFSSFPSDHAVLFFALCVPLWVRSRWLGAVAAVWTLLLICLPRLYLGFHWPSDVLAGAVIGVVLMFALCRLVRATGLPDTIVRFSARQPAAFYALAWLFLLEITMLFGDVRVFFVDVWRVIKPLMG